MEKELLLKSIADAGYNVGFGGRKHWATYDIVDKVPGLIAFFSMAIGIFALIYDELSTKDISAALLVFGLIGLYVSFYERDKDDYKVAGNKIIAHFVSLKKLYREVQICESPSEEHYKRLHEIESDFYSCSISKQILFSDWYAHYKFFWQYQIDWVSEQKEFKLIRDKIPLSAMICLFLLIVLVIAHFALNFSEYMALFLCVS